MDKKYISILAFLLVLSSMLMVSATVTLVSPVASSYNNGNLILLNVTNSSGFGEMVNCTIYGSSASTANNSATVLGFITNSTASAPFVNGSIFNSTTFQDASDYSIYATCWNISSNTQTSLAKTIIIDNTIPQTPSSLVPVASSTDADGAINFSATVTGANTTACTLYFSGRNPGASSYAMSHGGNSCYLNFASIPEETFDYYIQASDGYNTTNSATTRFAIDIESSSGFLFQNVGTQNVVGDSKILGMNPGLFWTILIILIIASIAYFKK